MHPQLAAAISKTTGRNRKASRTARTKGDEEPREPGALWGLSRCPADQKMRKKHTLVVCWPLAPAICPHTCTSLSGPGFLVTGGHTSLARRKALIVGGRGGGGVQGESGATFLQRTKMISDEQVPHNPACHGEKKNDAFR